MLRAEIVGSEELATTLRDLPEDIRAALMRKIYSVTMLVMQHILNDKLSGQVLNTITGRLKRSIQMDVRSEPEKIVGEVFSAGDVPYAAIHEYGGRTSPHEILPVKAQALAFIVGGKQIFAARVSHPGSVMPERSYMRSALDDLRDQVVSELERAVREALQ